MAKITNSYRMSIVEGSYGNKEIVLEKTGTSLTKKEKELLAQHNFAVNYKHVASACLTDENITKAFAVSAYFNHCTASEELIDAYRALRDDAHKPHYTHDMSSFSCIKQLLENKYKTGGN